ncbi:MAG: hypothetical protein UIH41_11280 [Treponemataceae bacterium]|nr:hypothetical protein [Treponemataceae bacterium]
MKKRFSTIILIVTILFVTLALGCDPKIKDSGEKIKQWETPQTYGGTGNVGTVSIELKEDDVTWWCWTDSEGKIIPDSGVEVYEEKSDDKIARGTILEKGKTYEFKFAEGYDGKNNLYIHQPNRTSGDYPNGTFDYRGWVKVSNNNGVAIKDTGAPQAVNKQVAIYFQNNEPVSGAGLGFGKSFFQNGDYTITEIWPLVPKNVENKDVGATYIVDEDLKYTGLKIVQGGPLVGFLFPVKENTDVIIALYQPGRANGAEEYFGKNYKYIENGGEKTGTFDEKALAEKKQEYFGLCVSSSELTSALSNKNREVTRASMSSFYSDDIDDVCFRKVGDNFVRTKSAFGVTIIDNVEPAYEGQK